MTRWTCTFAALALAACASTPAEPQSRRLDKKIFDDVPAPEKALYRSESGESFSFTTKGFRCGRFLFDYSGSEEEAVRFFKTWMQKPPYSWSLTDENRDVEGSTELSFVKSADECTIDVDRKAEFVEIAVRINYHK